MAIYYDDQGLPYEDQNPFGDALFYNIDAEVPYSAQNRPPLPGLTTPNPTKADMDLYALLQQAYSGNPDEVIPALHNGNLWIGDANGVGQSLSDALASGQLTDPGLRAYAQNATSNMSRTDSFSFLGDQFFPAVALLGAAVGAAAAYPALAGTAGAGAGATAGTAAGLGNVYGVELGAGGALAAGGGGASGLIVPATGGALAAGGAGAGAATAATGGAGAAGTAAGGAGTAAGTAGTAGTTLGTLADIAKIAGPAVTGLTGVIGAVNSGNAAKDAAETQANAAREANQLLRDIYTQNRADLGPYREAGYSSLGNLQSLAGQAQPQLQQNAAYNPAANQFYAPVNPINASSYAFTSPVGYPSAAAHTFTPNAPLNASQYGFTAPTLTDDPGYNFRLEQGRKALEKNLAAQGKYMSGAALQALTDYGQGMASQEYAAAYQRALGENQLRYGRDYAQNQDLYNRSLTANQLGYQRDIETNQLAYNRALGENQLWYDRDLAANNQAYQRALTENQLGYERGHAMTQEEYQRQLDAYNAAVANQQRQFGNYNTLASLGLGAATNTANLGQNFGNATAENLLGAANATAAGQIGSANAWNQGLSSVGNAAQQYLDYLILSQRK